MSQGNKTTEQSNYLNFDTFHKQISGACLYINACDIFDSTFYKNYIQLR